MLKHFDAKSQYFAVFDCGIPHNYCTITLWLFLVGIMPYAVALPCCTFLEGFFYVAAIHDIDAHLAITGISCLPKLWVNDL